MREMGTPAVGRMAEARLVFQAGFLGLETFLSGIGKPRKDSLSLMRISWILLVFWPTSRGLRRMYLG